MSSEHDERRAYDRDLQRVLRFMDGTGGEDVGCITKLDRLETLVRLVNARSKRNESRLRVIYSMASDHPLLDKKVAAEVVEYVKSGEGRARRMGVVAGFVGRSLFDRALQVGVLIALGWLAFHGVPVAH